MPDPKTHPGPLAGTDFSAPPQTESRLGAGRGKGGDGHDPALQAHGQGHSCDQGSQETLASQALPLLNHDKLTTLSYIPSAKARSGFLGTRVSHSSFSSLCFQGELNGQKGLVPSNFLEEVPDDVEVYLSDAPSHYSQDMPMRSKTKRVSTSTQHV